MKHKWLKTTKCFLLWLDLNFLLMVMETSCFLLLLLFQFYRSTSCKNGYTRHHQNTSQHGLLIVPNGYNHLSSSDPRLPYNNYDYHLANQNYEEVSYDVDHVSPDEKTNDKNCNYIFQNGGHGHTLDFNSNDKSSEYTYTVSDKSIF